MINLQLIVLLKERLKTASSLTLSLAIVFTLSVFSPSILAESKSIPNKGMTQDEVKAAFGEPLSIKAPVGKPPITRWDYQTYSVYFEGVYVIHSFYHNQQLKLQTKPTQPSSASNVGIVEAAPIDPNTSEKVPAAPAKENIEVKPAPVEKDSADETTIIEETPEVKETSTDSAEEVKVEEIPTAVVEEVKVEEIPTAIVEEVKVEEIKVEETVTKETGKDLNFEEPEKPADYGKWGY